MRVGRRRNAASASPRSTAATASLGSRRVRDALRREPVDDLGVEPVALEQLVPSLSVEDEAGQVISRTVDRRAA